MILPTFLSSFPYSLRGSIENSSCMGSTASSLHKHDLFQSSSTVHLLSTCDMSGRSDSPNLALTCPYGLVSPFSGTDTCRL